MPDATPSLGEILNFQVDPDLGGDAARPLFDNRQLIQTVNDNARYQAENNWIKYSAFQNQLADTFKNINDTAALEVATQDKEQLDNYRKQLLESIWQSPKEFFGSGNIKKRADIESKLAKYKSDATESKLNHTFDVLHRSFLEQNPELNTDENKQVIESYWQQPLGARKAYTLDMPTIFDANKFTKEVFALPGVTETLLKNEPTADNKFIDEFTETTIKRDKFLQNWMTGLLSTDKYGHSIKSFAEKEFKKLTPDQKKGLGVETADQFWKKYGEQTFGANEDIITKQQGKRVVNPYALEQQRAANRLLQDKKKHGYNMSEIELRGTLPGRSLAAKSKVLDAYVSSLIDESIKNGIPTSDGFVKLRLSPTDAKIYGIKNGFGGEDTPEILVSIAEDSPRVFKTIYSNEKNNGKFSRGTFTLDIGKNKFGLSQLSKQDIDFDEDEDEEVSVTPQTSPPVVNNPNKKWTKEDQQKLDKQFEQLDEDERRKKKT